MQAQQNAPTKLQWRQLSIRRSLHSSRDHFPGGNSLEFSIKRNAAIMPCFTVFRRDDQPPMAVRRRRQARVGTINVACAAHSSAWRAVPCEAPPFLCPCGSTITCNRMPAPLSGSETGEHCTQYKCRPCVSVYDAFFQTHVDTLVARRADEGLGRLCAVRSQH